MPQVAFQPRKRSHKDHHEDKETERPKKRSKHSPTPRERTASSGENEYIPSQLMTEPTIEHLTAYHLPNVVGGEVYYVPEVGLVFTLCIPPFTSIPKFVSRSIADRWYATLEKECPCKSLSKSSALSHSTYFFERVSSNVEIIWERSVTKSIYLR